MTSSSKKNSKEDTINKENDSIRKKAPEIQKNYKEFPRSYRLDSEMMDILKNTLHRINEVSPKKVSEARLVKALIVLSKDMDVEMLIKGIKQVW